MRGVIDRTGVCYNLALFSFSRNLYFYSYGYKLKTLVSITNNYDRME